MSDRSGFFKAWAVAIALLGPPQALAQPLCRPLVAFAEPRYSAMQLPRLERTWTVAFSVDASPCAASSGSLSIIFTVWSESSPDYEVAQTFNWQPNANLIAKNFWIDEAVWIYRAEVGLCPCR